MQVAKWGNSLAVRLSKALVDELGLQPGDEIDIVSATPGRLTVEKDGRREAALSRMSGRRWSAPESFRFNRDEANER